MADLQQAIELNPEHLSWYQLTIEPNTEFYNRPPSLPVDDELAAIQEQGHSRDVLLNSVGLQLPAINGVTTTEMYSIHSKLNLCPWPEVRVVQQQVVVPLHMTTELEVVEDAGTNRPSTGGRT